MRARAALYRQLHVQAWDRPGLSPLNIFLMAVIVANLLTMLLATESTLVEATGSLFAQLENVFLIVFSVEYVARVWTATENPRYRGFTGRLRYMLSFYSLIDLVAILPGYLTLGGIDATWVRILRVLRVLRFGRFGAFSVAISTFVHVFRSRVYELAVSLLVAGIVLLAASTVMFLAEGDAQPETFGSIPRALWWSVITMTTVGYGDVYPATTLGKMLAAVIAMVSIAIVAIPTGILAAAFGDEIARRKRQRPGRP